MRLIDSHCHLNYEGLVERQAEVLDECARARGRRLPQHLHAPARMGRHHRGRRARARRLGERRRPPARGRRRIPTSARPRWSRPRTTRASSRSASAGSIIITTSPTARPSASGSRRISRRRGRPACRWSSTRAMRRRTPRKSSKRAVKEGGVTGVLHCFTGSAELARKGLDLGFYISLSGIVTFKNAADLQATAKWLPADQMLVETDSPVPCAGPAPRDRNASRRSSPTRRASSLGCAARTPEQLADTTTANFFRLFKKARLRREGSGSSAAARRPASRRSATTGASATPTSRAIIA